MTARTEVSEEMIYDAHGVPHMVRADLRVSVLEFSGRNQNYVLEVKTYDPRCASWRDVKIATAEERLVKRGEGQYAPGTIVRVLAIGVDGTIGPKARSLLGELIELRDNKGVRLECDGSPDLYNILSAALARCEDESYTAWLEEFKRHARADRVRAAADAAVTTAQTD